MKVIAWGKKVGLRPFEDPLNDWEIERVYRWSCDGELIRLSGGTRTDLNFDEFRNRLRDESANPTNHRRAFFIITRAGELIGRAGCFAIDDHFDQGELGIVIGERHYWDKGYGRDAVLTLLRHLFAASPLERVNLFTFNSNLRARRCFAACGFRVLGAVRRFSPDVGEFDGVEMEITRREYAESHLITTPRPEWQHEIS